MRFQLINLAAELALLAACGSSTSLSYGGGGGGGGGGGRRTCRKRDRGKPLLQERHNGSQNPAVDTVMAGATVTWTWNESGTLHRVQSTGSPTFTSEPETQSTSGATYKVMFASPGTYTYDCSVHPSVMIGRILVQ